MTDLPQPILGTCESPHGQTVYQSITIGPHRQFEDCINWRPIPQPTPPKGETVRVAWEKAFVKIRVPIEGTMQGAWEETEIPLSVLFPTDEEFRAAVKRLTPVGNTNP